ncbi:MAG: ATP synthase subunit I [Burkholderiales bacterium]
MSGQIDPVLGKVYRIIGLQALAAAVAATLGGWVEGLHGAISAALGGLIGVVAGLAFALLVSRGRKKNSAGEALYAALKAEAVRVAVMVFLLWFVLATYKDVVVVGLIGSFIVSVLIFVLAGFFRDI